MSGNYTDPRVVFWTSIAQWPGNSPTHLFLGNVVHTVGAAIYAETWTGEEPATEVFSPLPEKLHASTGSAEICRGCRLLYARDDEYKASCNFLADLYEEWPIPTTEQWARGVAISHEIADARWQQFNRYIDVANRLAQAFKNGHVQTATREFGGGGETLQPQSFWYIENIWPRFATCQVDPKAPFNLSVISKGGDYIFVDQRSLVAAMNGPRAEPAQVESSSSPDDEYMSTYLRCMIAATRGLKITRDDLRKKDSIVADLDKYWPGDPKVLTGEDKQRMATLMREPFHKGGRARKKPEAE